MSAYVEQWAERLDERNDERLEPRDLAQRRERAEDAHRAQRAERRHRRHELQVHKGAWAQDIAQTATGLGNPDRRRFIECWPIDTHALHMSSAMPI